MRRLVLYKSGVYAQKVLGLTLGDLPVVRGSGLGVAVLGLPNLVEG